MKRLSWLIFLLYSQGVLADAVRVTSYQSYSSPPLSWYTACGNSATGLNTSIIERLFLQQGQTVTFVPTSKVSDQWLEQLNNDMETVLNQEADFSPAPTFLIAQQGLAATKHPFTYSHSAVLTRNGLKLQRLSELNGLKGAIDFANIKQHKQQLSQISPPPTTIQHIPLGLRKLIEGEIDYFITDRDIALAYSWDMKINGKIQTSNLGLPPIGYHLVVSKANPLASLLPGLDDSIQAMQVDGTARMLKSSNTTSWLREPDCKSTKTLDPSPH